MSKGSLFVSQGRGKVGNLVLQTLKGQQITKAYQPVVTNPKTNSQQVHRARFSNAVKFYKKAVQHFFQFAYEDKKKTESYYNAFMRHNVSRACYLRKDQVDDPYFPALGRWIMSQGSLAEAFTPVFSDSAVVGFKNTAITANDLTVAAVSARLIAQGFNAGDIVTIVLISSVVDALDFDFTNLYDSGDYSQPRWDIRQFIISTSDATNIANMARVGSNLGTLAVAAGQLQFTFANAGYSNFAACIVTRKGSGITYASNSQLIPNSVALDLIEETEESTWLAEVAASWKGTGDAILHGSIADGTQTSTEGVTTISSVNGGDVPATISLAPGSSATITVRGKNLPESAVASSNEAVTVSDFTINSKKTTASFKVAMASSASDVNANIVYAGQQVATVKTPTTEITSVNDSTSLPVAISLSMSANSQTVTVVGSMLPETEPTLSNSSHLSISNFTVNEAKTQATFTVQSSSNATSTITYAGQTIANVTASGYSDL